MMKIGLLGCGNIGHIIARHTGGFTIAAVYDEVYEKASEIAAISGNGLPVFCRICCMPISISLLRRLRQRGETLCRRSLGHDKDIVIMSVVMNMKMRSACMWRLWPAACAV